MDIVLTEISKQTLVELDWIGEANQMLRVILSWSLSSSDFGLPGDLNTEDYDNFQPKANHQSQRQGDERSDGDEGRIEL